MSAPHFANSVIVRGIEGNSIPDGDEDRLFFVFRFGDGGVYLTARDLRIILFTASVA